MRIVLSRKGFDTGSGGTASPIINGRPISLPIPTHHRSATTYHDIGLGDIVENVTRGKITRDRLCHHDPMFIDGQSLFGQCGAAQSHLRNRGVGIGDVFLFFGLFDDERTGERHHRIFGYMRVEEMLAPTIDLLVGLDRPHPHTLGQWNDNNTIYKGAGETANSDVDTLRLTQPGGPLCYWAVPGWLKRIGLSYHGKPQRWVENDRLNVVARGQEFVADIGNDSAAHDWLDLTIEAIRA